MSGKRVGFYTLGCKVSQYETEAIAEEFERRGFVRSPFESPCDVYVVNTCTVTAESDRKSRQMIRRAHKLNPDAIVMVTGCYAQSAPDALTAIDGVAYVGGNDEKLKLAARAEALLAGAPPMCEVVPLDNVPFEPMCITHAPRTRAYVKIEDGCECRCTYCAIPAARGPVRSKAPADVLREVRSLVQGGVREIVLTGIETASYGVDLDGFDLLDLLELLDLESGAERRLGSMTPEWFHPSRIERLSRLCSVTPHFHLSMQSGADAVLRGMRRRYNRTQAERAVEHLRRAFPRLQLTADFIVGFPGESDADFADTLAFAKMAGFLSMHVFAYSARRGTPAARMKEQIPESVKHARSEELIALGAVLHRENLAAVLARGETLSVLMETESDGVYHGHSDSFLEVLVKSTDELHGRIVRVRPTSIAGECLLGEIVN